jgi:hypothetical protein
MSQEHAYIAVKENIDRARNEAINNISPRQVSDYKSPINQGESINTISDSKIIDRKFDDVKEQLQAKEPIESSKTTEVISTNISEDKKPLISKGLIISVGALGLIVGGYFLYKRLKK